MLDPSLFIQGIPGIDEALPADVYSELTGEIADVVIGRIQCGELLGVCHNGQWYVEAPPFCEDRLRLIWSKRIDSSWDSARQDHKRQGSDDGHSAHHRAGGVDLELHYASVLGVKGKVSREDVKKRWRELTVQYHPDKVAHLGVKLREVAEREMKAINEAYEYFQKKYGI
jgi:hypothetical protein